MTAATGHSDTNLATAAAGEPARPSFGALGAALRRLLERGRSRARAHNALLQLDDRTLKDIGVHRTEISSLLHHDLHDPSRRPR